MFFINKKYYYMVNTIHNTIPNTIPNDDVTNKDYIPLYEYIQTNILLLLNKY